MEALVAAAILYGEEMAGFSINAAEHSTITSWGGPSEEIKVFEHMIDTFGKENSIFAVVSDTYNIWDACDNKWGGVLKEKVQNLGLINSKLVVRPDSGDPVDTPVQVIERLMDKFGYTVNQKGYKVLPPYIGVIQGDGINEQSVRAILSVMKMKGLSAENINFGMGGGLLQQVNRDTLKFAMKASAAKNPNVNNGDWYGIQKNPITDQGKKSKSGRLAVVTSSNGPMTVQESDLSDLGGEGQNLLQDVYLNGDILTVGNLSEIRNRVSEKL
jgi:nicotinamide phosphoribosyltransferase